MEYLYVALKCTASVLWRLPWLTEDSEGEIMAILKYISKLHIWADGSSQPQSRSRVKKSLED